MQRLTMEQGSPRLVSRPLRVRHHVGAKNAAGQRQRPRGFELTPDSWSVRSAGAQDLSPVLFCPVRGSDLLVSS